MLQFRAMEMAIERARKEHQEKMDDYNKNQGNSKHFMYAMAHLSANKKIDEKGKEKIAPFIKKKNWFLKLLKKLLE